MSKLEKEKIEEILLRWRGVKKMDVQLVRQQGMRLKNMKYEPKAELAPMRGLRPTGPEKEEGRMILNDQGCLHQRDCEQNNQQEDVVEDEDPPTTEERSRNLPRSQ